MGKLVKDWIDEATGYPCAIEEDGCLYVIVGVPKEHPQDHYPMPVGNITIEGEFHGAGQILEEFDSVSFKVSLVQHWWCLRYHLGHSDENGEVPNEGFAERQCLKLALQMKQVEEQSHAFNG